MQVSEPFKTDLRVGVRRLRDHIVERDLDIEELAAGIYESPDDLRRFLAGENDEFGAGPLIVLLDDLGLNSEDVFREFFAEMRANSEAAARRKARARK